MRHKSSKDFLAGFDEIWEEGPKVKYKNPDAWYLSKSSATKPKKRTY